MNYTIGEKRLKNLLYAERMLDELNAQGVDNWEGYGEVDWDHVDSEPDLAQEFSSSAFFTDAEFEALKGWFPRLAVANCVVPGSPEHTAIAKIAPRSIPTSFRNA